MAPLRKVLLAYLLLAVIALNVTAVVVIALHKNNAKTVINTPTATASNELSGLKTPESPAVDKRDEAEVKSESTVNNPRKETDNSVPQAQASATIATESTSNNPAMNVLNINEQFTGSTLNNNLWEVMTYPKAYRNNEEQAYRPSQVAVKNGTLQITATRDAGGQWQSGIIHSRWNYQYGEFEVRMALSATGPGVWPAAWLMGVSNQWPHNGELDIMENINGEPVVHGTIHGGGTKGHWQLQEHFYPIDVKQFNTYKIVKKPGHISWWVNGIQRGEWRQSQTPASGTWPFENQRNYALLNLAIGGTWPGPSNASTPNTIIMHVDYFTVRNGS